MSANNGKKIETPFHFAFVVLMMVPLPGMGIDLYTPSLPALVHAFGTTRSLVKLTIALYLWGYALGPLVFGPLADTYGRKKIFFIGMVLNLVSIAGILLWQNIHMMLFMRLLQGFSIGAVGSTFRTLVSDVYEPGISMRKMSSAMATTWALGPIIAPFIGGYLQHFYGWQANFLFFIVYGVIITIAMIFMPETHRHKQELKVSVLVQNFQKVFAHRLFWGGVLFMGVAYALIVIFNVYGPFIIQNVLHFTPIEFGHVALVMGFAFFLGGLFNRILVQKFPSRRLSFYSLCIIVIAGIVSIYLGMSFSANLWRFCIPVFVILFVSAILFPAGMAKCLSLFPESGGVSSAAMGFVFTCFTAIASAIASAFTASTQIPLGIGVLILAAFGFVGLILLNKKSSHA